MKTQYLAMTVSVAMFGFFGCGEKPGSEKAEKSVVIEQPTDTTGEQKTMVDKIDESVSAAGDAVSEAAEETENAVKQGVESVKESASEAGDVIESNVESIKENMEQSADDSEPAVGQVQEVIIAVPPPADTAPVQETVIEENVEAVEAGKPESP